MRPVGLVGNRGIGIAEELDRQPVNLGDTNKVAFGVSILGPSGIAHQKIIRDDVDQRV